ncbi:MAG TPA: hypothetical protein VEI54_03400 [Candidatus Limnocylindrales bacterium]|nr:hypothetical protein [Candidatus Limnocylindrales bacterium]
MTTGCLQDTAVIYRNFNLCPHCVFHGQQALLCRLCEGMPMISRSDGKSFHLLLADRPLPYPIERSSGSTGKISVCFWYSHVRHPKSTFSTIVVLTDARTNHPLVFRRIEDVADLLAEELALHGKLAPFYELSEEKAQANAS